MIVGFVGSITQFRYVSNKGIRHGQIDVIQIGDNQFTTKVYTIDIIDQISVAMILEILETVKLPLIRATLWIDVQKSDLIFQLIKLISVEQSLFEIAHQEEETYD